MPFSSQRFKRLCDLKSLKQVALAERISVSQSQISDCARGIGPSVDLLEKLATALDSTTDFLLGRHAPAADESEDLFRTVVSRMAYDVWAARINVDQTGIRRCYRVLGHPAAPLTADAWAILSEQIDLAIGPELSALRSLQKGS